MKYKVYCKKCKRDTVVSTRDVGFSNLKYPDQTETYSFDCPSCGEEIEVQKDRKWK